MLKKILALALALIMAVTFVACGGKEETETTTTTEAIDVNSDEVTDDNGGVTIENKKENSTDADQTEADGKTTTGKSDDKTTNGKSDGKTTTGKSDDKTTTGKSDGKTTTEKSDDKTTTKNEGMVVPSTTAEIVKAYREAANRTKAQNNMKVVKTCKVAININEVAGSKTIAGWANDIAGDYINQASGAEETEIFKNGKPTKNTAKNDKGEYVNAKNTYIPLYGRKELCTLDPKNVVSATAKKKTATTYEVVIKLKNDKSDMFKKPTITTQGMDHFNPDLYDLGAFKFASGTVSYTDCVIVATVNANGYIDYVKHDMNVKTTDAKLSVIGIKIGAKISGSYVTTFKFSK